MYTYIIIVYSFVVGIYMYNVYTIMKNDNTSTQYSICTCWHVVMSQLYCHLSTITILYYILVYYNVFISIRNFKTIELYVLNFKCDTVYEFIYLTTECFIFYDDELALPLVW